MHLILSDEQSKNAGRRGSRQNTDVVEIRNAPGSVQATGYTKDVD